MSNRTSILIGGIIKTVATVIAALSTDVRVLFFSIGIVDGNKYTSYLNFDDHACLCIIVSNNLIYYTFLPTTK